MKLGLELGQTAMWRRRIDAEHVRMYRDITGDANPLHFDEVYARATIFGRLIVHGGITAGALNALVAERMPGPGSVFIKQELEYLGPAYVGDELSAHGEVVWLHDSKPVCRLEVRVTARGPGDASERICIKGQCVVYRAVLA
ncbi:MAG TPA: MaoC family dehydratase [Burkholderiales bacterium]|nr:MaoC family dehydratase [Burkholderiales bacterium]